MKSPLFEISRIKVLLHLLAWSILIGLPLYFTRRWQVGNDFIWLYYINILIGGIIFYINYLFLLPTLFFRQRRHWYFISALLTLLAFYFVSDKSNELVFKNITGRPGMEDIRRPPDQSERQGHPIRGRFDGPPPFRQMHAFNYTFTSVFMLFFSMGLRILERQSRIEKLQKEMEREKLNSELAFLKNQVSPHFFFNTLNNIYALIDINKNDSQKAILKLSKLMRYMLYESERKDTKLSQEIEFMYNYIDLMKLRMTKKIDLSVSFPSKFEDFNFPPLIFIPFIENAFKYGVSNRKKSFIRIAMTLEGNSILLHCSNSIVQDPDNQEVKQVGIGLENVTKRLNLLFPGKHELKIGPSGDVFEVILKIILPS